MGFFISMFICNLIVPVIMVIAGYCMYKKPPKDINGIVGYRTTMSRKNADTWLFAHNYCGRLWIKIGVIILILTIIVQIPFIHSNENIVGTVTLIIDAVQLTCLVGSIFIVEKALKKNFDTYIQ